MRGPGKSHFPADFVTKKSLIVVEVQIELSSTLTERPSLFAHIDLGLVVGDTDRHSVVVVSRDGGPLQAGVALIARLFIVSYRN